MLSLVARQNQLGTNWLMYIFTTAALNLKCTATVLPRSKKKKERKKSELKMQNETNLALFAD